MEFPVNSAYFSLNSSLFVQQANEMQNRHQSSNFYLKERYQSTTSHQASNQQSNYNCKSGGQQYSQQENMSDDIFLQNSSLRKRVRELEAQLNQEKRKVLQMNGITIKLSERLKIMANECQQKNINFAKLIEQRVWTIIQRQQQIYCKQQSTLSTQRMFQNKSVMQMTGNNIERTVAIGFDKAKHKRSKSKDRCYDVFSSVNSEKQNRNAMNTMSNYNNMTLPAELGNKDHHISKQLQSNRISENNKNRNRIMSNLNFMNKQDIKKAIKTLSKIECRIKK